MYKPLYNDGDLEREVYSRSYVPQGEVDVEMVEADEVLKLVARMRDEYEVERLKSQAEANTLRVEIFVLKAKVYAMGGES
jgi:hypothetical protein